MSFNGFAFEPSIHARLTTGAIAAATQGAWNTLAPPSIKAEKGSDPFIIFELIDGQYDPTFVDNIAEATYRVSVYDHARNGLAPGIAVAALVYGDSEGTDNAPTVGLARWMIPAVTDVATAIVRPETFGTQHTDAMLHFWQTFAVTLQEA
jgi:hypothetical protein